LVRAIWNTVGPLDRPDEPRLREALDHMLRTLSPRAAHVLRERFGLGKGPARTLAAIGDELGLTRERIRQIQDQALQTLRLLDRRQLLDPILRLRPPAPAEDTSPPKGPEVR
jgi:DNA-directed RNA polymerase sigma subunit (sigma70/sigma32)